MGEAVSIFLTLSLTFSMTEFWRRSPGSFLGALDGRGYRVDYRGNRARELHIRLDRLNRRRDRAAPAVPEDHHEVRAERGDAVFDAAEYAVVQGG